jgi:hypothetical protein
MKDEINSGLSKAIVLKKITQGKERNYIFGKWVSHHSNL